jgi:hypothetical protein
MTRLFTVFFILSSCSNTNSNKIDNKHIEDLAENFMRTSVIPKMKDPKPYEIVGSKVVRKTVADNITDYRFVYDHLSFNQADSMENKRHLDSVIKVSFHPDSIVSITVNVAYKTRYQHGDIVIDSIKLGYNREKDAIFLWPF